VARIASSPNYEWLLLAEYNLPGERENTDFAGEGALFVVDCVKKLNLPRARLARLETAVRDAVSNLFQRSMPSGGSPLPLAIRVFVPENGVTDGSQAAGLKPAVHVEETPGRGWQAGKGWGFFLVEKVADSVQHAAQPAAQRATQITPHQPVEHSGRWSGGFENSNGPKPPQLSLHHAIDIFLYLEGESTG
jgi:hypothetical protein